MNMWKRYFIILGFLGIVAFFLFSYYQGDNSSSKKAKKKYITPLVQATIYGVVTKVSRTDSDDILFGDQGKEFYYFDLNENWEKHFMTDINEPIQIGDTIKKESGQNYYVLKRGRQTYRSFPIDKNIPL